MIYYVFVFKARTGAVKFNEALKREGINSSLINTPKAAGIGCGLSVKTDDLAYSRRVLASERIGSFYMVLKAVTINGAIRYEKLK